jgi:N-glycosylase/DNA lyase
LSSATEGGLAECKAGFRAKYIIDAALKWASGGIPRTDDESLYEKLLGIKGVGEKVADCVMLFGYGRVNRYPTDVWVKRATERFYFGGETKKPSEIQAFAVKKFGGYAGYAQMYMFNYIRYSHMNNSSEAKN